MSKLKVLKPVEDNDEFFSVDDTASNDGDDEQNHAKLLDSIAKMGKSKK